MKFLDIEYRTGIDGVGARAGEQPAPHWYVVRAKPGQDLLTARGIDRLGLELFHPFARPEITAGPKRRGRPAPLFRGYLFVRFLADQWLEAVRFVPGVAYVVSSGRTPLPVESEVIAELRARLGPDGFFPLRRTPFLRDQKVAVKDGAFAGLVGRVEREWDDGRRVAILLEALQDARVLLPSESLALVEITPAGR